MVMVVVYLKFNSLMRAAQLLESNSTLERSSWENMSTLRSSMVIS